MMTNDERRRRLGALGPYRKLSIISKFDTATLTVKDLYELEQAAYRRGYIDSIARHDFERYGIEH